MVPKSHVLELKRRGEELELAGGKALEVDVFKKPSRSKDSDYPREHKLIGEGCGMFVGDGVAGAGTHPLSQAPVESGVNGLAEALFGNVKRDDRYQACLEPLEDVVRQVPTWIDHDNREASHSALGCRRQPSPMRSGESQTRHDLPTINRSCTVLKVLSFVRTGEPAGTRTQDPRLKRAKRWIHTEA